MKDLIILGAGIHAQEMVEIVERVNRCQMQWNLLGFLTTQVDQIGKTFNDLPVLGGPEKLAEFPNAQFVPDNTWPRVSHADQDAPPATATNRAPAEPRVPRHQLISLIDPSCFISRTATIGRGCVLYPHCYVGAQATIGDWVFCLSGAIINHNDIICDRNTICSGVSLAGSVTVESDCYIGQASTIRQLLKIGAGSTIGIGAVVIKDVPPRSIMIGNPAIKLRDAT